MCHFRSLRVRCRNSSGVFWDFLKTTSQTGYCGSRSGCTFFRASGRESLASQIRSVRNPSVNRSSLWTSPAGCDIYELQGDIIHVRHRFQGGWREI